MTITNVFDAAREGSFSEFTRLFDGNVKQINQYTKLNLLITSLVSDENKADRLKIIEYLLLRKIDVNFVTSKLGHNALHVLFINVTHGNIEFYYEVISLLIKFGINLNEKDKYGAIPLKYALTSNKLETQEMIVIYRLLLDAGSDYRLKDNFNKSCIDYASELTWRNGFLDLL